MRNDMIKVSDGNFVAYAAWGMCSFVWLIGAHPYKYYIAGFSLFMAVFYNIIARINYAKGL